MSVVKRGDRYAIKFAPFGKEVWVTTEATIKSEALELEAIIRRAIRTGDYGILDSAARESCVRLFTNQGWELPENLVERVKPRAPLQSLTLWRAMELFLNYPGIAEAKARDRYIYALKALTTHFGKEALVKEIRIPHLKEYQLARQREGAAADTVNREMSTLSKLFGVLMELEHVDSNPCRLVKRLSNKEGLRQVYLSFADVERIVDRSPEWYRSIVWTGYYTGMRRGEILELTRAQVSFPKRVIFLGPTQTKEGNWKRVPVHSALLPILEAAVKLRTIASDRVFLLRDKRGVRPVSLEGARNPWPRAVNALKWPDPKPRFHDLRHTWRTNARRSKIDPQIAEAILGHWFRGLGVNERYGYISDDELTDAIDRMTFDWGPTQIWTARSSFCPPVAKS